MALVKINAALNHWAIFNQSGTATQFWSRITSGANISNDVLTLQQTPFPQASWAAPIDMGRDTGNALARDNDRLILAKNSEFRLALSGVEYVQVAPGFTVDLVQVGVGGFTTDGSVRNLSANVGNHTIVYENAVRDSTVFLGNGYDRVTLATNPDVVAQGQNSYWITRRLADNSVISYSLYSGNTIQFAGGGLGMGAVPSRGNYGEIEIMDFRDRNNGLRQFRPGNDTIADAGARLGFDNIDLSDLGQDNYTDSFLHASFGSINFTSKNVFTGAAVIQDWFDDEATAQEGAANQQSAALRWQTTSVSDAAHNHDLMVAQQTDAIDGHLRVYVRNETTAAYNRFNEVFLGTSASEVVTRTGASTVGNGLTNSTQNVALYGFGGNDVLTAGGGSDYLFGGTSTFSTIPSVLTGNVITGGDGNDFFGVGNISVGQDGDNLLTTNFSARLSGAAPAFNTPTGQLSRVDASDAADLATRVGTDRIQDWTAGADSLRVLGNGTAIIEGLGTANGQGGAYGVDLIGADAEIIDLSGPKVVNDGKIVARGFDGNDTLIGSTGDDWLYGNGGVNRYQLGEGGNDRVYVDQFANATSKHIVNNFATSAAVASDTDLVMLNKAIVDAFFAAGATRTTFTQNSVGNYIRSTAYNPGIDYLHDNFYNPAIATTSGTHDGTDGSKVFAGGPSGADGTTSLIGIGMLVAGRALLAVPIVGPIIGGALITAGTILELAPTQEHLNARYDGAADGYLNVITQTPGSQGDGSLLRPTTSVNTDDRPAFLSFFESPNAGDGYIPVVEFTQRAGQGVYGFFALHSDTETFVYLVVSRDNLVEEAETFLIAQINGHLSATDFGIYDSASDVYNFGTIPAVVLRDPAITLVYEQNNLANRGDVDGRITNLNSSVVISGTVANGIDPTATFRLYDGATKIFDGPAGTTGGQVTLSFDGTNFSFVDSRALGTIVRNTTNNANGNDTHVLADERVSYTVELIDPNTGIPTRDTTIPITITGGNVTIDGGAGDDILLLTETSDFVNNASNTKIVGFETIVLAGSASGNPPVPTAISVDLRLQEEGFRIASGGTGDTIVGSRGNDTITGSGGADSIDGFDGDDSVVFTNSYQQDADGNFILVGGNRVLDTAAGDQLDADATVIGGLGFDTIQIDGETQTVSLGDALFDKVTQFEGLTLTGTGAQTVTLGKNTDSAFANGITVTTAATAASLTLDGVSSTVSINATGTNNNDLMEGGSANDTLIGNAGDDVIDGNDGADSIDAGANDDIVLIQSGADLNADATVIGGTGTDTIRTYTGVGAVTLVDSDFDKVTQFENLDLFGLGLQSLTLGTNTDAAFANGITVTTRFNATLNLQGALSTVTINATGSNNADTMVGGIAADTLIGGNGNDSLTGGTGADSLVGGDGDDQFYVNASNEVAPGESYAGDAGSDTLWVLADADFTGVTTFTSIERIILADDVDVIFDAAALTGDTIAIFGTGNTPNLETVTVNGTASGEVIDLAGITPFSATVGGLTINALGGADTIVATVGDDTITGGGGADFIIAGNGTDILVFASASELAGDVTVNGGADNDTVLMSTGSSTLNLVDSDFAHVTQVERLTLAGTGTQSVTLGSNTDAAFASGITLTVNAAATSLYLEGAPSLVTIDATGTDNRDTLIGGSADDALYGGGGDDVLLGNDGNDVFDGNDGTNVIWGGQGLDTVTATSAGAVNKVIIVGDLSSYSGDAAKMALINSTLDSLLGYNHTDVTTAYTTDVVAGETIAFDGTGDDEIHAFGVVDLTNVTITGAFTVYTYSTLTMTQAQLSLAKQINVVGPSSHTIIITDNDGTALTIDDQQAAVDAWLDANGKQLGFSAANGPVRVGVGGQILPFTANGNGYVAEDIAPVPDSRNGAGMPVGNPIGANPNSSNLLFDTDLDGFDDPLTINRKHFRIDTNDRFKNAQFVSTFTPGQTVLPVPDTFLGTGDNRVHNRQFEVYYGDYDVRTGVFSVTGLPGSGRTTYTLILYDNDTSNNVEWIEGIVFANWMQEHTWSLANGGTPNATLSAPTMADSGIYDSTFGTDAANALTGTGSGKIDYLYGRNGDDTISGDGGGDFIIAGSGNDLITPGTGENIVDLGDDTFDASFGDGDDDIVVLNAVAGVSSDSGRYVTAGNANDTGQDILFNFELNRDTIRVVATAVSFFNHTANTGVGTAGSSNTGDAARFENTTGYVDLNADGTIAAGDLAVTFRNLGGSGSFESRVQYVLTGTSGDNVIATGDLDDTITGGQGEDYLDGGAGSDTFIVNGTSDVGNSSGGEFYDGGAGVDRILATANTNFANLDFIRIEILEAAAGVGLILYGNDLSGQTIAINGTGDDGGETLTITGFGFAENLNFSGLTLDTNDISGALIDVGGGDDTVNATNGNDTILAGDGNDSIRGADGNDSILGGLGLDTLFGNAGDDYIDGGDGADDINGGADNDTIVGGDGNDAINDGSTGNDSLVGGAGDDIILQSTGDDTIVGGTGADILGVDTMFSGAGNDTFIINGTADIAAGESYDGGTDNGDRLLVTADTDFAGVTSIVRIENIDAAAGVDLTFDASLLTGQTIAINGTGNDGGENLTINGTASNDTINLAGLTIDTNDISGAWIDAAAGNDSVIGTSGNDTILGGLGDDTLVAGAGVDSLVGGDGADVFKFTLNSDTTTNNTISEMDVIDGFSAVDDTLDLSAFGTLSAGPTATFDPADSDSYVVQWTKGGITNYVYLKDTGVTGGLTLSSSGGVVSAVGSSVLNLALRSVTSSGITTRGDGPHRAYYTQGDSAPNPRNASTFYTESGNVGASTDYTFALADIAAVDASVHTGLIAIRATNSGAVTYLDARVYVGGNTATADIITADLTSASRTLNYAIVYGQGGNDTITGSAGNDYLFGGDGNDTITGGGGFDNVSGDSGDDTFVIITQDLGNNSPETISGGDGTDTLLITNDAAVFDGFTSAMTNLEVIKLQGPNGQVLHLGAAAAASFNNVTVIVDPAATRLELNASNIGVNDTITATGTNFNDTMIGGGAADTLNGGNGNDMIIGGGGNDVISGGAGADVFAVNTFAAAGMDFISDFNWSEDKIDTPFNVTYYNDVGVLTGSSWAAVLDLAASRNGSAGVSPDNSYDAIVFVFQARQYILITRDENDGTPVGGNTYNAATDILIDITGATGLAPYSPFPFGELPGTSPVQPFI